MIFWNVLEKLVFRHQCGVAEFSGVVFEDKLWQLAPWVPSPDSEVLVNFNHLEKSSDKYPIPRNHCERVSRILALHHTFVWPQSRLIILSI
jgi:hypothetical protein